MTFQSSSFHSSRRNRWGLNVSVNLSRKATFELALGGTAYSVLQKNGEGDAEDQRPYPIFVAV